MVDTHIYLTPLVLKALQHGSDILCLKNGRDDNVGRRLGVLADLKPCELLRLCMSWSAALVFERISPSHTQSLEEWHNRLTL